MHSTAIAPLTPVDRAVLGFAIVLPTAVTWLYFIALAGADSRLQQGAYALGKTVQFALPLVSICLVRRTWPRLSRPSISSLAAGAAFGLLVGLAIVALYAKALSPSGLLTQPSLAVREKVQSFGAGTPLRYLVLATFYSAIHSLLEEYYWRWFVFGE